MIISNLLQVTFIVILVLSILAAVNTKKLYLSNDTAIELEPREGRASKQQAQLQQQQQAKEHRDEEASSLNSQQQSSPQWMSERESDETNNGDDEESQPSSWDFDEPRPSLTWRARVDLRLIRIRQSAKHFWKSFRRRVSFCPPQPSSSKYGSFRSGSRSRSHSEKKASVGQQISRFTSFEEHPGKKKHRAYFSLEDASRDKVSSSTFDEHRSGSKISNRTSLDISSMINELADQSPFDDHPKQQIQSHSPRAQDRPKRPKVSDKFSFDEDQPRRKTRSHGERHFRSRNRDTSDPDEESSQYRPFQFNSHRDDLMEPFNSKSKSKLPKGQSKSHDDRRKVDEEFEWAKF